MNHKSKIQNQKSTIAPSLVMASDAIKGRLPLPVAIHANPHRQIYGAHRHGLLGHIPMAGFAFEVGAEMRRMVEFDVRRRRIVVDALPRDILTSRRVGRQLFDLGFFRRHRFMARHAQLHPRKARHRAGFRRGVTVCALQPVRKVDFVSVGDGLNRRRPSVEELPHRVQYRPMRWSEHRGRWGGPLQPRALRIDVREERKEKANDATGNEDYP